MLENGKTRSSLEIFCLTVRKKILGTTSKFQIVWDFGNFYAYHGFSSIFLSHSTETLREEPSSVSESLKREVSKKFMNKNGIWRLSVESFLSEGAENFRWLYFGISEKFSYRKISWLRGWYDFSSWKFFSRILPISFLVEPLSVSESLVLRKILCSVGGSATFRRFFWPSITENFRE